MTLDLRALRPTDDAIDAEFTPIRRAALLADVLDQPTTARRSRQTTRRRLALVAATVILLTGAGAMSAPMLQRLPGGDLRPVQAQPAAADGLVELARRAAGTTTPAIPGPTQYLAVVTVDQQSGQPPIRHESYTARDGWTWRKDTERGRRTWFIYAASAQLDASRLPADADRLEATLRQQWLGTQSYERGLFKLVGEIARSETAPLEVRAASLRLLARLAERPVATVPDRKGGQTKPRITVLDGTLSGRAMIGAQFTDDLRPGDRVTYWFDRASSELIRTDQRSADGSTFGSEVRSRAVVDDLPDPLKAKLGTDRIEKIEK